MPQVGNDAMGIDVWINAFIPKHIRGLTHTVPNSSRTVIAGPPLFDCFFTDNRSYSQSLNASYRIQAGATDLNILMEETRSFRRVGRTKRVDCESGRVIRSARASTSGIRVEFRRPLDHQLICYVTAGVSNPLVPGSPDIDIKTAFSLNVATGRVSISGWVDDFPAFEAYVSHNGNTKMLRRLGPKRGASPYSLFGPASREFKGETYL